MQLKDLRSLNVKEDEELLNKEKETYFSISGEDKNKLKISSNQKEIMQYMLNCDDLKVTNYYTNKMNDIIHLEGNLPISYIRFKNKETESMNYLSRVLP